MKDPAKLQAKRAKAEAKLATKIRAARDKAAKKIASIKRDLDDEETLLREDFELVRSKIDGKLAAVDAAVQARSVRQRPRPPKASSTAQSRRRTKVSRATR